MGLGALEWVFLGVWVFLAVTHYQDNKDKIKTISKEYYEKNKDKINAMQNTPYICDICNGKYTHNNRAKHFKSHKHQTAVNNND